MASAAAPTTKSISDPRRDVAYAPIDGFTPMGPGRWADVLQATYTVAKGDNLTVTIKTADLPKANSEAAAWGVDGTVTLADGSKESFNAWVTSSGVDHASVGSSTCGSSASVTSRTNTVVVKVDFTSCVPGSAKVRLRAKGTVKGSSSDAEATYYQAVYTDVTAHKIIRVT